MELPPEDPRCYACGAPISTNDTTLWNISLMYRDACENLQNIRFTIADDSHMAIVYLNGMYHRGFFAHTDPHVPHMVIIPTSRVVEVSVSVHDENTYAA